MGDMDALRKDFKFQNYSVKGMAGEMEEEINILKAQLQSALEENAILRRSTEKLELQLKSVHSNNYGKLC